MTPFMSIALFVALFLLNSDRIQKAIEICSECLILLNGTDQNSKDQFDSALLQFYSDIYTVLFSAYRHISDYISAERYGRKLFDLYNESTIMLYKLGESLKAKEYFERAPAITTKNECRPYHLTKHPLTKPPLHTRKHPTKVDTTTQKKNRQRSYILWYNPPF